MSLANRVRELELVYYLARVNGALFYNVLARTPNRNLRKTLPNTQRLFAIMPDSNLET